PHLAAGAVRQQPLQSSSGVSSRTISNLRSREFIPARGSISLQEGETPMTATERRPSAAAAEITAAAAASFETCPAPRLRQLLHALVRHLHAFASEVNLTEDEWVHAVQLLTATGHITDDKRQEFILWSDALGVSMLVDALNHPSANGATESTVLGP